MTLEYWFMLLVATLIATVAIASGVRGGICCLQRCRVPSKVAVATSVFVVAVSALTAAGGLTSA